MKPLLPAAYPASSPTTGRLPILPPHRTEAERFLKEFRERLAKFGLELHPDKTRLIEFGRFAARDRKARGEGKPETFTFLGFTHFCGQRNRDGAFIVWRITGLKSTLQGSLKSLRDSYTNEFCRTWFRKHDFLQRL